MILITALITSIINSITSKKRLLGSSGIVFMLIILSSLVNITSKIPVTLILICLFYIVNEILDGIFKKDNVSHLGHILGAVCGCVFGFGFMYL